MCQSWCGCAGLESVPLKDSEMESLVSASLHQIRLRPCVKGSCLFLSSFSLSKGQMSRPRSVPSTLLSHIIYGYSTTDGYSKVLGYTADIRIQGCSLSAKWHFGVGQNRSKPTRLQDFNCKEGNLWESTQRGGTGTEKMWSLWNLKYKTKRRMLAKDSLAQQMLTGCFFPGEVLE